MIISEIGELRQMEAPEEYYLTQSDESVENRVYVRKRIILSAADASAWRPAGEAVETRRVRRLGRIGRNVDVRSLRAIPVWRGGL